ncbi:MAG: Holliday junction branch migration protein RuvA [Candidatus Eisenbacteria bacterium]|nr:Holliday junction branch migration protein RuvA [Candidatus Eisenbacteria bacterium]
MIASIRGILLERADSSCIVEAAGVGYLVQVSAQTLAELPAQGAEVRLLTRHIVREDAQLLFGFTGADELRLFDLLIGVSGVGPKIALAALSGLQPAALARAIRDEQIAAIVAVPGIGRKTAERIVVELRDKLDFIAACAGTASRPKGEGVLPRSERFDDAVAALVTLGYSASQSQEAVRKAGGESADLSLEDIVKRALGRLSKPAALSR